MNVTWIAPGIFPRSSISQGKVMPTEPSFLSWCLSGNDVPLNKTCLTDAVPVMGSLH